MASKNILKFRLRGLLQELQNKILFIFLGAVQKLLAESVILDNLLQQLEEEINMALALMERDLPSTIDVWFTITASW